MWRQLYSVKVGTLVFHAKLGLERLQGGAAGLLLAHAGPPFHQHCDLALVIALGCWITDLDTSSH